MITFTVNWTPESEMIIAKRLWYSDTTVWNIDNTWISPIITTIPNPQTPQEFIWQVFSAKFWKEVSDLLIVYNDEQKQAIYDAEDKAIRDTVQATISYQVIQYRMIWEIIPQKLLTIV